MKGHKLMDSRRMENDGHDNIYFRLAHIGDAVVGLSQGWRRFLRH